MSKRLQKAKALVLKSTKFGEIHKRVALFTDQHGILYVNAYGAAKGKSKLAGIIQQFSMLSVNLYFDPVKNSYKLTEANILREHSELHTNLKKYYAANIVAEVLFKSFGGGDITPFFNLFSEILNSINNYPLDTMCNILIQFFWRYIHHAGFAPELTVCGKCGKEIHSEQYIYFDIQYHAVYCPACKRDGMEKLNRGEINYLDHTGRLSTDAALKVTLQEQDEKHLLELFIKFTETIIEGTIVSAHLWREV